MKRIYSALIAVGVFIALVAGIAQASSAQPASNKPHSKVWVCKYVGKPGVNERLKAGKNPISVSSSATVGTWFNDAQGRSYVVAVDNGGPAPSASQCPPGDTGPTDPPTTSVPSTDVPTTDAPSTDIPSTDTPTTDVPTTDTPTTDVPTTDTPSTDVPTTSEAVTTSKAVSTPATTTTPVKRSSSATHAVGPPLVVSRSSTPVANRTDLAETGSLTSTLLSIGLLSIIAGTVGLWYGRKPQHNR